MTDREALQLAVDLLAQIQRVTSDPDFSTIDKCLDQIEAGTGVTAEDRV